MTCALDGNAELWVGSSAGRSVVLGCRARSPLRLLTPRANREAVWAYTSSFGGGMVAGDTTRLSVRIDAGARCFLSTQSSTKIYRNPKRLPCGHELDVTLEQDALLVLAPDPVQCFAESRYEQDQCFNLSSSSNLVLVDWLSSGRVARGERWSFDRYFSRNVIKREGKTVLIDPLLLDARHGPLDGKFRGGKFNCLATVVLLGPLLAARAQELFEWAASQPINPEASLVFAASHLAEGLLLRFAGTQVDETAKAIQSHLHFVAALIADDPWSRKR